VQEKNNNESIVVPIQPKILCGRRAVNNEPSSGMNTKNGDWPWQVAIFQLLEFELSYVRGGLRVISSPVISSRVVSSPVISSRVISSRVISSRVISSRGYFVAGSFRRGSFCRGSFCRGSFHRGSFRRGSFRRVP
jgi:hypothetical protein